MASVSFTDGTGSATLQNGRPAPADRFANWTPDVDPVGPRKPALGTGTTYQFAFRTDYLVAFEVDQLPSTAVAVALRLKAHLLAGNSCTVTTGDTASRTYTCVLAPDTVPSLVFSDRKRLRYTFKVALKNTSAAALLCEY